MGSERDIITERNSEIRELELENDLLRGETGSLDLYIRQLKAEATERDARIAALTEELERVKEERAAIRAAFERKSNDPEVSAVVQAAFGCVVFAFDYPDKLVDNYRKEPR